MTTHARRIANTAHISKSNTQTLPQYQITPQLYKKIEKQILQPVIEGRNTSVMTFKKAGLPFSLEQSILQASSRLDTFKRTMFLWISFDSEQNVSAILGKLLLTIKRTYTDQLRPEVLSILDVTLSKETVSLGEFLAFCDFVHFDEHFKLVFIIKDFDQLYIRGETNEQINLLENIYLHCGKYASFVFLSNADFADRKVPNNTSIWGVFSSTILWGKDFLQTEADLITQIKFFEEKFDIKYPPFFVNALKGYSTNDPTVVLYSLYKTLSDEEFLLSFKNINSENAYSTFGQEYLNWRFNLITERLTDSEIKGLKNKDTNSRFLTNTGLLKIKGTKIVYLNPLFEYYVKNVLSSKSKKNEPVATKELIKLVGQELLVFELLKTNMNQIVPKDKIAEKIWGQEWEQKYSDWALDKLMHSLKKKLVLVDPSLEILTFRKLGFKLSPRDQALDPNNL